MIDYFKVLNGITEEITFSLFNEDEPKTELAGRDKIIFEMGYQPTQEYIEKTYNIKTNPRELQEQEKNSKVIQNTLNNPLKPFKTPLNKNLAFDAIDNFTENLKLKDLDLDSILQNANSYEEALDLIEKSLQGEDLEMAESLLAEAILNAQIYGAINA